MRDASLATQLFEDDRPDLVIFSDCCPLSNLAAREAALHGRPAIAISHYCRRGLAVDWPRAGDWTVKAIGELMAAGSAEGRYFNVNLPHLDPGAPFPERKRVPVDPSPLPLRFTAVGAELRYAGDYHERVRIPGADVATCFAGDISVSELRL
jgi:5'-nucleotidase